MPMGRFEKQRVQLETGEWSMVYSLEIAPQELKFEDLHPMSSYVRQQDIARMHYARAKARGHDKPDILTWTAVQTDRRAEQMFPGLDYSFDDEHIISANSFITFVLRQLLSRGWLQLHEYISDTYESHTEIAAENSHWRSRAEAMTRWLEESIQLDLYPNIEIGSYQPRFFVNSMPGVTLCASAAATSSVTSFKISNQRRHLTPRISCTSLTTLSAIIRDMAMPSA